MTRRPLILAAAIGIVAACGPPQTSQRIYPIANTPEAIAACQANPGGFPEWSSQVPGQLLCRVVP